MKVTSSGRPSSNLGKNQILDRLGGSCVLSFEAHVGQAEFRLTQPIRGTNSTEGGWEVLLDAPPKHPVQSSWMDAPLSAFMGGFVSVEVVRVRFDSANSLLGVVVGIIAFLGQTETGVLDKFEGWETVHEFGPIGYWEVPIRFSDDWNGVRVVPFTTNPSLVMPRLRVEVSLQLAEPPSE